VGPRQEGKISHCREPEQDCPTSSMLLYRPTGIITSGCRIMIYISHEIPEFYVQCLRTWPSLAFRQNCTSGCRWRVCYILHFLLQMACSDIYCTSCCRWRVLIYSTRAHSTQVNEAVAWWSINIKGWVQITPHFSDVIKQN
jgi:hypothetical protein